MENTSWKLVILGVITVLSLILSGYLVYRIYTLSKINTQNELALTEKIEFLEDSTSTLFYKYAGVVDLNELYKRNNNTLSREVATLSAINIDLRTIIDSSTGTVEIDTTRGEIDEDPIEKFHFLVARELYKYELNVWNTRPPTHVLKFDLKPFQIQVDISRLQNGKWVGVGRVIPKAFGQLIDSIETTILVDESLWESKEDLGSFRLYPMIGSNFGVTAFISAGALAIINEQYAIMYMKGIGNDYHQVFVGYKLNFTKILGAIF